MTPMALLAVVSTGVAVTTALAVLHPPRRRLADRVRPYAAPSLRALGRPVGRIPVAGARRTGRGVAGLLVDVLHGGGDDPALRRRLVQAHRYDVPEADVVDEHRIRQVLAGLLGGLVGLGAGLLVGLPGVGVVASAGLVGVSGALRPTAAVDRALATRRRRLRAELPAVCQLLAVRLRASGSVVGAVALTVQRTRGLLAEELAEALAQHRAGRPLDEALDAVALQTCEPEVARVHRLLAGAIRHGLDAAPELLRLARDARTAHLQRLRRDATTRRAALLLPVVGLLAPLMLLFIAAPLPGLVLGS